MEIWWQYEIVNLSKSILLKMRKFLLILLFPFHTLFAQDSTVYRQKDEIIFSNTYIFYSDKTFKHIFNSEDGVIWFGQGTFTDRGRCRLLKFGAPVKSDPYAEFQKIHYEMNFERKLKRKNKIFISKDYYNTTSKRYVLFEKVNK